ncbi:MAG: 50S ribosomal protein L15 [Acidimicrobiia bacterium]
MKVHDLKPAPGSTKPKHRVGRGIAGKGGKTAGRGTKGQKARGSVKPGFEGGQLPLVQRIPKLRGFNNPFRVEYVVINVGDLADLGITEITPAALRSRGLIPKKGLVKVLGNGELTTALTVSAHAFSKSAEHAITAAGGTVAVLPKPWAVRPAAQGNHLANR